jgi:hypothetical protein
MVYRRYERIHERKNYTQIVEIFQTIQRPPEFIEDEKALNDFLGRDAFKSDMNCTHEDSTEGISTTTENVDIKTTTTHRRTASSTTPNLNQLFTIKPTRSTIRPNPKENKNPDYTELYIVPKPNVQVTKHRPSTISPPLIVIQETDVRQKTTVKPRTKTTTETVEDDRHYYPDDENENNIADKNQNNYSFESDYNENNYELVDENGMIVDDNVSLDEFEDGDFDAKKRRKRLMNLRHKRTHKRKN